MIAQRDRIVGALIERMDAARRAIGFVFRNDPGMLKKCECSYTRARRRARNRKASKKAKPS